ncbi:arginase family protein [bacterium]|nr:arginase family protein [candidate division CSSED10-310 bacterium]
MTRRMIISPFFLDQALPELMALQDEHSVLNIPELMGGSLQDRIACIHKPLAELVASAVRDGVFPASVSGDCCSAIAVLAGLQRAGICPLLIWFDAHGDFNTWETTPSGFLGGMPLAILSGLGDQMLPKALDMKPLSHEQIILSDARSLDPLESDLLSGTAVRHYPDPAALLSLDIKDTPIYVHFDTDILPSGIVPAQNYPEPGGPSLELMKRIFWKLKHSGRLVAASLSSWNPSLDTDGQSCRISMKLFKILTG